MRTRSFLVALTVAVAGLAGPSAVSAQTMQPILEVDPPSGWTGLSGDPGLNSTVIQWGAGWILHGVGFGERRDRPCYIQSSFSRQVPGGREDVGTYRDGNQVRGVRVEVETQEERTCEGGSETASSRRYLSYNNSTGDPVRAVHGVRVCQRASNDRIKGIRILGSEITKDGPDRDPGLAITEERTNCNDWNDPVLCPTGEVAVALRVEYRGESAVGLSLRCAAVRMVTG